MTYELGDDSIDKDELATMAGVARAIDMVFNGEATGKDRKMGFVLLTMPFHVNGASVNYITNIEGPADICELLEEAIGALSGRRRPAGNA